jgi:Ankyrin repeat
MSCTRPERLVHHARLAESTTGRPQCDFLDSVPDELIDRKIFRQHSTDWFPINTVMALAVVADLRLYVRQKLVEKGSQIVNQNPDISLLHCAVWSARRFLIRAKVEGGPAASAFNLYDMVKLLLEHGADINAKFRGLTPFQYLFYQGNLTPGEYSFSFDMIDIARVILEHGQNPNVPIIAGHSKDQYLLDLVPGHGKGQYPLDLVRGEMAELLRAHKAVHFHSNLSACF